MTAPAGLLLSSEDRLAIEELSARYNQAIDDGDAEGWTACFTADGVFETRPGGAWSEERGIPVVRVEGSDQLRAFAGAAAEGPRVRHWSVNRVLQPQEDVVRGRSYLVLFVLEGPHSDELVTGLSEEELVPTPQGWRFRCRRFTVDR